MLDRAALETEIAALCEELGMPALDNSALKPESVESRAKGLRRKADAKRKADAAKAAEATPPAAPTGSEPPAAEPPAAEGTAEAAPGATVEPQPPAAATPPGAVPEQAKACSYVIASGKALTSLRGILDAGTKVSARDFHGGEATLAHLLERGHVVRS